MFDVISQVTNLGLSKGEYDRLYGKNWKGNIKNAAHATTRMII